MSGPAAAGRARRARRDAAVELRFLEGVRRRCPPDALVLEALGELYTRVGRYADGLAADLELVGLRPEDQTAWYNLGCDYALLGRADDAFAALGRAVELGYADASWLMRDSDLARIRSDPRFAGLVARLRRRAAATRRPA